MLTSIPSPPQSVWMLGPIPIRAYALFILAGILIAWYMGDKRYQRRGGPENVSEDIGIWMVLAGIVGARIYHVITSPTAYFGDHGDWTKIFRIWEGGLGIWGAVLFGALAAWLMLRRYNLRFGAFADAFIPGVMLAQAIGRMGNYFNQELFGAPTDVPWALEIDDAHLPAGFPSGTTFHPTFLYEMLWCIAGFMFLLWAERKFSLHGGQVLALYIIVYTLGRVWIEYLRRVLHCTPRRMSPKVRTLTEAMRMPTEMSSTMPRKELQSGSVPDEGPRVLFWTMRRAAPSEKLRKAAICEGFCWPRNFCTRLTGTCRSRSSSPRA